LLIEMRRLSPLTWAFGLSLFMHLVLLSWLAPRHDQPEPALQVVLQPAAAGGGVSGVARQPAKGRQTSTHATASPRAAAPPPLTVPSQKAAPTAAVAPGAAPSAAVVSTMGGATATAANSPSTAGGNGMAGAAASPVTPARYLGDAQNPPYPERARERGEEGRAVVRITIAADGQIEKVELLQSSGFDELDQAALELLRKGPYAPARRAGVSIASKLRMSVPFRLGAP
jgi:protein TonB